MQSNIILARQYGPRTAATLRSLINTLGETNYCKLVIDGGEWIIDETFSIPANIVPEILPDTQMAISLGCTLTILSQYFMYYRSDWKTGAGLVSIPDPVAISVAATLLEGGPDLDALVSSGEYYGAIADELPWTGSTKPPASLCILPAYVKVVKVDAENVIQTFTSSSPIASSYTRALVNGLWGDWVLLSARMATTTEMSAMTRNDLLTSPLLLQNFLNINYAYYQKTDSERMTTLLAWSNVNKATERLEPATRFGLTITPKFSNSKILIMGTLYLGTRVVAYNPRIFINRKVGDEESVEVATAPDSRIATQGVFGSMGYCNKDHQVSPVPIMLITDAQSVIAHQYYVTFFIRDTGDGLGINRSWTHTDNYYGCAFTTTSTLLAVELPQKS